MKLLMVTRESQADKRYGLGKSLAPLLAEWQQRGIEVSYLCCADAGEKSVATMRLIHRWLIKLGGRFFTETEIVPLLWGLLERLNMGRLAAKVMARERYTHVHCHDPIIAAGYRWFARLRFLAQLRRGHTARWGVTEHGFGCYAEAFHIDGARLGTKMMRWLRNWEAKILTKAHWVMTPTQSGLLQLARDLSLYPIPSTWRSIYHPRPVLTHYPKTAARQQLGWPAATIYIIAVGRFAPLKQLPALIQACASLPKAGRPWQLVLIGEGDNSSLQTLAVALGVADRLSFAVSDDMGLYYSAADIYVSTSLTESFGLANLEALTMGLPALCTAVGGVPEVVGSGAYLIPAQNPQALVTALQSLVESRPLRHYWQQQARLWCQRWPELSQVAEAYLAMYDGSQILNNGQSLKVSSPLEVAASLSTAFSEWQQQVSQWSLCPLPPALELPLHAKILLIAPHPDDETLGCGGTLALLRQRGCQVKVVIVTDGGKGDPLGYITEEVVSKRQRESLAAMTVLGIEEIIFLGQPDGEYQHTPLVAAQLQTLMTDYAADWLFSPSILDYHRDHVAISLSVMETWVHLGCRERFFWYETWAPIPATWVVDISRVWALKQQATQCYELPLKYCDYLKACLGMANYRGLYLVEAGQGEYAEAFMEWSAGSWQEVLEELMRIRVGTKI